MPGKILNAGKSDSSRSAATQALTEAGYEVVETTDGGEALELSRQRQPALVLLDGNLAGMAGLCRRIRESCPQRPAIIVRISGTGEEINDLVGKLEGAPDGYLTEPVPPRLLVAAVRSLLRVTEAGRTAAASEAALRGLAESNLIGVASVAAGQVVAANQEFLRIAGCPPEALQTGRIGWREITPPEDEAREAATAAELRKRGFCAPYKREFVRPDGSRVRVLAAGTVLPDATERSLRFAVDLSETVEAHERLSRMEAALDRSHEEQRRFAYVLSHDLQSPLRTVSGMAGILARRYADSLDAQAAELIGMIQHGAEQMGGLISALLDYSRVQSEPARPATPVNAGAAADWALMNLAKAVEASGVRIRRGPLPWVWAGDGLSRVFELLLDNAIKFRRGEPPEIEIRAESRDDDWLFVVRDNGIGFDPAYADRIFGIFKRLHPAGRYEGTGIGLAICRELVERYGGRIWAESEPDRGSSFFFTLPAAEAPAGRGA